MGEIKLSSSWGAGSPKRLPTSPAMRTAGTFGVGKSARGKAGTSLADAALQHPRMSEGLSLMAGA